MRSGMTLEVDGIKYPIDYSTKWLSDGKNRWIVYMIEYKGYKVQERYFNRATEKIKKIIRESIDI